MTILSKTTCGSVQWGFLYPLSLPTTLLDDLIMLFLLLVLLVSVTTQFSYGHSEYLICLVLVLPTWHNKQKMEDTFSHRYTQCCWAQDTFSST